MGYPNAYRRGSERYGNPARRSSAAPPARRQGRTRSDNARTPVRSPAARPFPGRSGVPRIPLNRALMQALKYGTRLHPATRLLGFALDAYQIWATREVVTPAVPGYRVWCGPSAFDADYSAGRWFAAGGGSNLCGAKNQGFTKGATSPSQVLSSGNPVAFYWADEKNVPALDGSPRGHIRQVWVRDVANWAGFRPYIRPMPLQWPFPFPVAWRMPGLMPEAVPILQPMPLPLPPPIRYGNPLSARPATSMGLSRAGNRASSRRRGKRDAEPSQRPEPIPARRPPGRRTKETKLKGNPGLAAALGFVANLNEDLKWYRDILDAFYGALPNQYKVKDATVFQKANALYRHWDKVDINDAVVSVLQAYAFEKFGGNIERARSYVAEKLNLWKVQVPT